MHPEIIEPSKNFANNLLEFALFSDGAFFNTHLQMKIRRKADLDADKMLRQLYRSPRKIAAFSRMSDSNGVIYSRYSGGTIASILAKHGLVDDESFLDSGCDVLTLTLKGRKVQEAGGLLVYLNRLDSEAEAEKEQSKPKISDWLMKSWFQMG